MLIIMLLEIQYQLMTNAQKIQFMTAIIHNPELVVLDEPFSGLDPVNTEILKNIIIDLVKEGKYVIMSAHQMATIEEFCSDILILNKGKTVLQGNLKKIKETYPANRVEIDVKQDIRKYITEFELEIENKEIEEAIIIEKQENDIKIRYIVENTTMMEDVPEDIVNTINSLYMNMQINKLDLTQKELESITPNFEFSLEQTEDEKASGNILAMMFMSIVLFYAIYFCAYQVSSSITTEKTSKIMETLVTSTSPRTIVLGKTIGIGVVGLLQMIIIVGTALVSAKSFLDPELLNSLLDMSNITLYLGIITIIYFILGYFAYALLYALTGSTVSKPEDIQSANTPVAILAVIGFYLSYFTMMNPTSELNLFASLFPVSSSFCMPFRIMMGLANGTDVAISIILLIATILIIAKVAIKIYSNAILNYGTKMNFKDIINVYKDKQN